jgi:uncharacterized protein (TIGR03067 family)
MSRPAIVLAVAALGVVVASPAAGVDPVKRDLERMQGTWEERFEPEDQPPGTSRLLLVIKGDRMTQWFEGVKGSTGTFTLGRRGGQKTIDKKHGSRHVLTVWRGLYQLEGDTLTLCFAPRSKSRPKDLSGKGPAGGTRIVYRRVKKP